MYALSTLNVLITTYLHLMLLEKKEIDYKLLIFIGISALAGSLTHYYYLFYLAMMFIMFAIKYPSIPIFKTNKSIRFAIIITKEDRTPEAAIIFSFSSPFAIPVNIAERELKIYIKTKNFKYLLNVGMILNCTFAITSSANGNRLIKKYFTATTIKLPLSVSLSRAYLNIPS